MTLLLTTGVHAETVATKDRTRLRQGPSATTELLGELEPDTKLEVLGESGGWRQVRTPDGRVGYVWGDHLAGRQPEPQKPVVAEPARTIADDERELREEVSALRQRPEPATGADLERVRQDVERLAAGERELARRLDEHLAPPPPPADPPSDGTAAFAPTLLLTGAAAGFIASRLLQRRRDRRQRNRLRL